MWRVPPPPPPPMKGVWCSGCHSLRCLIKGVGQGKGGATQPNHLPPTMGMLGVGEVKGSQLGRVKVKVTRMRELNAHCSSLVYTAHSLWYTDLSPWLECRVSN